MKLLIAFTLALFALGLAPTPARAQGPTATNTPPPTWTPYAPPTTQYGSLLTTPTPWQVTPAALGDFSGFDFEGKAPEIANTMINAYKWLNWSGVVDWILFILLGFGVLRIVINFIQSMTPED